MTIAYDYAKSPHDIEGPSAALCVLFERQKPGSILDVGCGIGTWLRAAHDLGVSEVRGIDGQPRALGRLLIPADRFSCHDLREPFDLGRKFDLVLCLEVAEHLPEAAAERLVRSLAAHGDTILFSAGCPGQPGQQHINCQWPEWWQALFNKQSYSCSDAIRWRLWPNRQIEPWYRQNVFMATRDVDRAGAEPRVLPVIHPDMMRVMSGLGNRLPPAIAEALRTARGMRRRVFGQ
jgi:SAM-dependent methyltransferase